MDALHRRTTLVAAALTLALEPAPWAQQPVLQRGYDANVSGATLSETTLTAGNVAPSTFGLRFTLPVDDVIYAQPLYVPNVAIPNLGTANVVYVATMSDTVYAFDADQGGLPLWSVNLAALFNTTAAVWADFAVPPADPAGNLGILSTPVIDPSTNILYVVACTVENSVMVYRLHALDIATGSEPYGPGVLSGGSDGPSTFDARYHLQRMSLALSGNQVVFGFSGMPQNLPGNYLGWVMAYNKQTLQQSGIFAPVTTLNLQGGVWQSGRPPAVDASGYVYLFTGNTRGGGYNGVNDFSESALKLDPANGLALLDWFTAGNWMYLDANDLDLSSSGPLLIPGTALLTGGGKTGDLYVLDTNDLGQWNADDSQVVQSEYITSGGEIVGGPVYWEGSTVTGGPLIYDWGAGDVLKAFPFNGSTFAAAPSAQGSFTALFPGGLLALSADGNAAGSAVVWATTPANPKGNPPVANAALRAYDAENISTELWDSTMNAPRDGFGIYAKFVPPLVANGKVYVATASKKVAVYGLLPDIVSPTAMAFGDELLLTTSAARSVTVTNVGAAVLPLAGIDIAGKSTAFSQTNTCGSSLEGGATCTITVVFEPTQTGGQTATLQVDAGGANGTQPVQLSGTGVATAFIVSPASLTFGSQPHGSRSVPQTVTVTNTSGGALPIAGISLTGNSTQFSQTNNCGNSVAAGMSCTIAVVFDPISAGSKTATLHIDAGASGVTKTVKLSGTGT